MGRLIDSLLDILEQAGGDNAAIEVKAAAGGLPESLTESLSALANLPGGGTVILGLAERNGELQPVGLSDPQVLKQGLGDKARAYVPPIKLTISDDVVAGRTVIVATVHECPSADKPCKLRSTGTAYGRSHDGDHALSDIEVQAFLRNRNAPNADQQPVPGSGVADLDSQLIDAWREQITLSADRLSAFAGDEQLRRAGIVLADGTLSRAGLLTFGKYPQQFIPRYAISAADMRGTGRARNPELITGPIPVMLSEAMTWLRKNMAVNVIADARGSLKDEPEFPLEALRELVANALLHRDTNDWSDSRAVEMRLHDGKFVITNPGGLYGITRDRLGYEEVSSTRNARLVSLCYHARVPNDGSRVVEGLASGLRRVAQTLSDRGLPSAIYDDYGISFTAVLRNAHRPAPGHDTDSVDLKTSNLLTPLQGRVLSQLRLHGRQSAEQIGSATGDSKETVRQVLKRLRQYGLVEMAGTSRNTTYRASPGTSMDG